MDTKSSVHLAEDGIKGNLVRSDSSGVKVTVDREIGYDPTERYRR